MSKKPTWVEMLENSIEELKNEYDKRFQKLEERLTRNIAELQLELFFSIFFLLRALTPTKDSKEILDSFLDSLKENFLDKWKEIGIMIFKEEKVLNDVVDLAKAYGIKSFEDVIKILVTKFDIKLIKESMTIEKVTEQYGTEAAKIFREFR